MKRKKIIIGVVGPFGAGKSTVTKYFIQNGFTGIRLSSFLEEEVKKRYGKIDRQRLQDIGNEFRKKYGPSILAQWAVEKAGDKEKIAIDGIRNTTEIKFFKNQDDFFLLGIIADPVVRFKRLKKSKTKGLSSFKDFLRFDARDNGRGQSKYGLQVVKCLKQADYLIENNETLDKLYQKVDKFLKNL